MSNPFRSNGKSKANILPLSRSDISFNSRLENSNNVKGNGKGKEKETNPIAASSPPASNLNPVRVVPKITLVNPIIRFSNGVLPDLELPSTSANQITSVWIKNKIRNQHPEIKERRLKLIHGGRIISEKTNFLRDVLRINKEGASNGSEPEDNEPRKIYIHCLVGDNLTPEELIKENELDATQPEKSTSEAPIGFDRLRTAGFTEQEIADLRRQFSSLYGGSLAGGDADVRALEERWIESGAGPGDDEFANAAGSSALGGNEDLLLGIMMGFFLGLLSVYFMRESSLYSKRQRMAILAGLATNCAFSILRLYY